MLFSFLPGLDQFHDKQLLLKVLLLFLLSFTLVKKDWIGIISYDTR